MKRRSKNIAIAACALAATGAITTPIIIITNSNNSSTSSNSTSMSSTGASKPNSLGYISSKDLIDVDGTLYFKADSSAQAKHDNEHPIQLRKDDKGLIIVVECDKDGLSVEKGQMPKKATKIVAIECTRHS